MARELNRLNVKKVKSDLIPGKYLDGGGLMLVVHPSGSKNWVVRTTVRKKRRDIGVGGFPTVSLAEARDQRDRIVRLARSGGDPLAERRKESMIPTFREAVQQVVEERRSTWRDAKHAQQWPNTLRDYCYPTIGDEKVDTIDGASVRRCLEPIWTTKHETASRTLQRCKVVFDWAIGKGYRETANPCVGLKNTLPRVLVRPQHHKAMSWRDIPAFFARLQSIRSTSALGLQFIILTASRSKEVRLANWSEFSGEVWTVPGNRMKMGVEHRVPLTSQMKVVLQRAMGLDEKLVFPGQRSGRPMSDMTMLKLLRSHSDGDLTVHGFRSAFRDWVDEHLHGDGDVAEACLAHSKGNAVTKAYARSDLLERRRKMLIAWNEFLTKKV